MRLRSGDESVRETIDSTRAVFAFAGDDGTIGSRVVGEGIGTD